MSDSSALYDQFHDWRRELDAALSNIDHGHLLAIAGELRTAALLIQGEIERRQPPSDRRDARLYRPKGQP